MVNVYARKIISTYCFLNECVKAIKHKTKSGYIIFFKYISTVNINFYNRFLKLPILNPFYNSVIIIWQIVSIMTF